MENTLTVGRFYRLMTRAQNAFRSVSAVSNLRDDLNFRTGSGAWTVKPVSHHHERFVKMTEARQKLDGLVNTTKTHFAPGYNSQETRGKMNQEDIQNIPLDAPTLKTIFEKASANPERLLPLLITTIEQNVTDPDGKVAFNKIIRDDLPKLEDCELMVYWFQHLQNTLYPGQA